MQNIHLNYTEKYEFPTPNAYVSIHSFMYGELYCSNGSQAFSFGKDSGIKSTDVGTAVSYFGFSDYHDSPIAFAEDGIYQIQEEVTKIFDPSEDVEGKILNGQLFDGGAKAIVARETGLFILDFEKGERKEINGINGKIITISVRKDNKFIALATEQTLYTICTENCEIHGQSQVEGITSLSWSPRLTWLAAICGKQVKFFEKNTEPRTSIELENELSSISYSNDGDVLAVVSSAAGEITVLSTKNRVWSKKFIISCNPGTKIFWNDTKTFELVSADDYGYTINYFDATKDSDGNNIYVTDGNILKVSHWDRSLIPPPLCHEKIEFDSQITCIACTEEKLAVFTRKTLNIPATKESVELPGLVHCAAFRGDELFFAVKTKLYMYNGTINEVEENEQFISFLTPNFTVYDGSNIVPVSGDASITAVEKIDSFTDNEGVPFYTLASGTLIEGDTVVCQNVYSYLATGKLLTYVHNTNKLVIKYDNNQTEHLVENNAVVLFFVKKLYSIIIQMQRGNTETQAPHVIVEARMAELLKEKKYSDALFISKRYQVPFNRIIRLGEISIPDLLQQIQDSKLRPFISVLTPIYKDERAKDKKPKTQEELMQMEEDKRKMLPECEMDKKFIIELLSYIFDTQIVFENGKVQFPNEIGEKNISKDFFSVACICFILLDNPVAAIHFACSIKDAEISQQALEFLLTLFDAERLFDLSMKTYDLRCIRTVGHVTMKEPSSYIPMLEEFAKDERNVMMAKIDEEVDDFSEAIYHYAACGPQYYNKCMNLAINEKLFDEGIRALPEDTEQHKKVFLAKVELLNKEKKYEELAKMVAISKDEETIMKYLDKVIIAGLHSLVIQYISPENYEAVLEKLVSTGRLEDAAMFAVNKLNSPERAADIFVKCHQWANAVQCGKDTEEIAEIAFKYHYNKAINDKKQAEVLKAKFNDIKEKQKGHVDSNKRTGKKKNERGLPALSEKLRALEPTLEYHNTVEVAKTLLLQCNREDDINALNAAYGAAVRALYPIPSLPENEQCLIPNYLECFFDKTK